MVSKSYKQFAQKVLGVPDSETSFQEVKNEIRKLKNNKASGNDPIANEMIKACSDVILPTPYNLLNTILNGEYFPKMWSVGFIVPIQSGTQVKFCWSRDHNNWTAENVFYAQWYFSKMELEPVAG